LRQDVLEANEPFVTFDHQQRLKQRSRNGQDFDGIGQRVAADNKQAKTAHTQRRARIQVEIPNRLQGMTSEQATKDLWKDPEATLFSWQVRSVRCLRQSTSTLSNSCIQ
jgi:hypothetical protein